MNEAVALSIARERWEASMLGKGARAEGFLELPGVTDEVKAQKYREAWNKVHGGTENAGELGLLINGAKFVPTSWSPRRCRSPTPGSSRSPRWGGCTTCRSTCWANLERATLANIEEQNIMFYQLTLMPWITMIEQELNLKLFSRMERRRFTVRHDPTTFLKANLAAMIARDQSDFETGQASTNELRVRNGKPKLDHPNADKHYIPGNNLIAIEDMRAPTPVEQSDPDDASDVLFSVGKGDDQAPPVETVDAIRDVIADVLGRWQTKEANAVERAVKAADPLAAVRAFYSRERPKLGDALAPSMAVARHVLKREDLAEFEASSLEGSPRSRPSSRPSSRTSSPPPSPATSPGAVPTTPRPAPPESWSPGREDPPPRPRRRPVLQDAAGQPPSLEGYIAKFNVLSEILYDEEIADGPFVEVIAPGAFDRSIAHNDIVALFNHDTCKVLGRMSANTLTLSRRRRRVALQEPPARHDPRSGHAGRREDQERQGCSFGFTIRQVEP